MKSFQAFRLDEVNQCLWRGDTRVSLMPKPFAVLRYLVEHAGRLVTHDELLTAIWPETYVQPEVLRRYILEIRRALSDQAGGPRFVETLPKRGYKFIAPVIESADEGSAVAIRTKLVGRQWALNELDKYLRNALHGHRQVVFVSGEAGIGKTSLVDAFQLRTGHIPTTRIVRGQSVEGFGGKEAYYPIFEALGQLARGNSSGDVVNTLTKHAPTWIVQLPSLVRPNQYAALKREILGATRERMVRELCEALEVITQKETLAIILEDLHWADHSTLDLISAIARRRQTAKLLILATFRPADLILTESPLKALKQDLLIHQLAFEILLERLTESDVGDYLGERFAGAELSTGFATVIHKHSDGNPLFMTAMLDHLVQQGALSETGGRWLMTTPLEKVDPGVPETLRQMLEVQLQYLSDAQQQLLKCASVDGEHFTAWSVATMMERPAPEVEEQCAALAERQQFLKASGAREFSNGVLSSAYEFRHSLYREVLYRRLNPTQRVNFHQRLANGIEALRFEDGTGAAAKIALHFEEGREYERAVQYLMLAAENATRRYAHHESSQALEYALELLPRIKAEKRAQLDVQILERLGDSLYALGAMERSAATYQAMATRAAEAGLLTAQANALMRLAHSAEAIPFFLRAVELDPNFASAYVNLSRIYSNLGEVERAKEYARQAHELREHASERERLSIVYQYEFEVAGDQSRASQTLEIWRRLFPEEYQPANSLAYIHNVLGDFNLAIEEGKEAFRRNPSHGFPYSNLAHAFRGLGRFDEARRIAEQAVELNIETLPTRRLLYQLAILDNDEETAKRHLEWGRDKPREFEFVAARAQVAACSGKLREARELYEETARMADARNLAEAGSNHLAASVWMEMAFGNKERALDGARRLLARNPGYDPRLRAALTLAICGCADEAQAIADELTKANPEHTIIKSVLAPIVRAGIAITRNQPAQAIAELRLVAPYEFGFCAVFAPVYLRAQSYLLEASGDQETDAQDAGNQAASVQAAEEFQRILDHRGTEPFSPFYAVAPLGLARAHAMAGNLTASLRAYQQFLISWANADSDAPLLLAAGDEYERVKSGATALAVNAPIS
jgi:DNA-binding winged helix-turn-helix (wHTH) protein/tetratricopeptide (TPR) repeat protein